MISGSNDAKREKQATVEKSNMSVVRLLPKAFLLSEPAMESTLPSPVLSGLPKWKPTHGTLHFPSWTMTDSGSGGWRGIARAANGDLRNRRFVAKYLNPPILGRIGIYVVRARV